jgi:ABC-2 type transport system ATP-binding protein
MDNQIAIEAKNIKKTFRLPHEQYSGAKQLFVNIFKQKLGYEVQRVLDDVSFEVRKGEFFGIIGRNGSGKSTLLKILAGIYSIDEGDVKIGGTLTPFIELGVGFNPELTGRENVFMNGALLGFSRKQMQDLYNDIVSFAELDKFMDQKLKNYSSGMQVRLAFSIAIQAKSDILLLDEVLAVGDALFQQKCYDYFEEIKRSGRTVVFISHDMGAIQTFCDRAILIEKGEKRAEGKPLEVIQRYNEILSTSDTHKDQFEDTTLLHIGVGGAEVLKGEILTLEGKVVEKINEKEPFTIRIHYRTMKSIEHSVLGVGIMGDHGQSIMGPNTKEANFDPGGLPKRGYFDIEFPSNPLAPGTYTIRAGILNASVTVPYDLVENLAKLTIVGNRRYGDIYIEPRWSNHSLTGSQK